MMALFKNRSNRIAVRVAMASFFLGTLLMLTALIAKNEVIVTLGIVFLVIYIPITLVLLPILFVNTLINFRNIHEHVMTIIIVLMNLPIALLYIYFLNP